MYYYKKRPNRQYNLKDVYRWLLAGWEVETAEICYQNGEELLALSLSRPLTGKAGAVRSVIQNAAVTTDLNDVYIT